MRLSERPGGSPFKVRERFSLRRLRKTEIHAGLIAGLKWTLRPVWPELPSRRSCRAHKKFSNGRRRENRSRTLNGLPPGPLT